MKSKYGFWKHGFNCLAGLACLAGFACLTGCKELSCDFSYSPTTPAAGKVVTFSNMSVGADDYLWNFGDNGTSTSTSPTHIYRKPGTYTVTLQIIRNKVEKRSRTQHITVIDTIPAIACDSDEIYAFLPVKLYAQVYNPWKRAITYKWTLPEDAVVLAGKELDSAAVVVYFTQEDTNHQVGLSLQIGDKKANQLTYDFVPVHQESTSVIYANSQDTLQQFNYMIQKTRVFSAASSSSSIDRALLRQEQDTIYHYGDSIYTVAKVSKLLKQDIKGFQVNRLMNKIYAYGNSGLWVCNITGAYPRRLPTMAPIGAIKVDTVNNLLYWANQDSLLTHRLLSTTDNQQSFVSSVVTTQHKNISRISINPNLH